MKIVGHSWRSRASSKVKNILRSIGARSYPDLAKAIDTAFSQVSLNDIFNWFAHCCYCTSRLLRNAIKALKQKLEFQSKDFYTCFHSDYHEEHKKLFELSREFLLQQALSKKDSVKASLQLYESSISGNWKDKRKVKENLTEHIQNLSLIFPVITTTLLSIRNMLPWVSGCVDRAKLS